MPLSVKQRPKVTIKEKLQVHMNESEIKHLPVSNNDDLTKIVKSPIVNNLSKVNDLTQAHRLHK